MEEELSRSEILKLPYTLLLDPLTGKGAAYTSNHRLITPEASRKLVDFALARHIRRVAWNPKMHNPDGLWHALPVWATPEVLARAELLWLREDASGAEHLKALAKK